jgi:hypothetical protein
VEINKGSKDINIYTGNGPSEIELFAAKELQRYISMLTGEPLKIKDRCECSSIEQRRKSQYHYRYPLLAL